MFDEALFIIAVYCLICDVYQVLYPQGVRHRGFAPQLTDEEALTIVIIGEYLGLGKDKAIYEYFYKHYRDWFPGLSSRTSLVRQWANLWHVEQAIWQTLVKQSGADRSRFQAIDTMPIPVCAIKRYKRRQVFCDDVLYEASVGYCASKDWYYFGFKGGIRIAENGMIVHAPLLAARPHDSQHTDALLAGTPAGVFALGDKAFLDDERQTAYRDHYNLRLLTPLRAGMQPTAFELPAALKGIRQLVETVNGQLVERFKVQEMRVRKGWTLLSRWFRKILAHTVCVWLNLQFNRKPLDFAGLVSVK
jgi:hypothetical protein